MVCYMYMLRSISDLMEAFPKRLPSKVYDDDPEGLAEPKLWWKDIVHEVSSYDTHRNFKVQEAHCSCCRF